ncbi:FemAB family PEP-CTERM system-associated protein [Pseudomaricurvus alkylphenolicus]|uniref:FemAB family XrtA/PEP-CTERM system-associated protein n=1 Tax=Pseudomaricurvus alkylphenolicus TaxID=1306991 RepID=UPI001424A093|nr:FemAB family XrtA/PEP-CTERM system-associated protein [Pseudomaricurvus alkylphenolicus]NIB43136.1 FemAB family PEP-CTERM system-associated protein [Pseudomaricurvus alkylphenolicus]
MSLVVKELTSSDFKRWDDYVLSSAQATFFHKAGWKTVLEKAYGHDAHFFYAEQNGQVVGILPLGHIKSLLFGNSLTSLPFAVYGGIVADSSGAAELLRETACELADSLEVDSLEMRNCRPSGWNWPTKELYVTFRKEIVEDAEANLLAIPNKQRAVVRKGIKAGLQGEQGWDCDRIYRVYSESVRNLGTPVFPKKYFKVLREVFGDDCRSLMITHEAKDVAGVLSFYFKDQVLPYYAGSTAASRGLYAHGFMYYELMRRAGEEGVRVFDYGRSKVGTGSYSFKKNWGFKPEPLYYEYYLVKSKEIPEVNPANPKYQLFIEAWKRLPLAAANCFGPLLARSLG